MDKEITSADLVELGKAEYEYGIELPSGLIIWDKYKAQGVFQQVDFERLSTEAERGKASDLYSNHLRQIGATASPEDNIYELDFVRRGRVVAYTKMEDVTRGS